MSGRVEPGTETNRHMDLGTNLPVCSLVGRVCRSNYRAPYQEQQLPERAFRPADYLIMRFNIKSKRWLAIQYIKRINKVIINRKNANLHFALSAIIAA